MKVKVTKQDIRECVESAMMRIIREGKSLHKFRDNEDKFGDGKPKHGKLNGKGGQTKQKGGANRQRWQDWDNEY